MTAEDKTTVSFNLAKVDTYAYVDGEQEWYKDDILHERRVPELKVNLNRPGKQARASSPNRQPEAEAKDIRPHMRNLALYDAARALRNARVMAEEASDRPWGLWRQILILMHVLGSSDTQSFG